MQYQQPPYQPYRPGPPPRRNNGLKIFLIIAGSVVGALVLLIVVAVALAPAQHENSTGAGSSQPQASTGAGSPPARARAVKHVKAKVLATYRGTGDENTPKFQVAGSWKLRWSYDCSSYGYPGNFIVLEDNSFSGGAQVNEEGKVGHGATWSYNDSGRHYLNVSSECKWTVKVVGTR